MSYSSRSDGTDRGAELPGSPVLLHPRLQGVFKPLATFTVRVPEGPDATPGTGTCTDGQVPSSIGLRPLRPAFAPPPPRAAWWNLIVDWDIFPSKRTKSATNRTSNQVEMHDIRSGALDS